MKNDASSSAGNDATERFGRDVLRVLGNGIDKVKHKELHSIVRNTVQEAPKNVGRAKLAFMVCEEVRRWLMFLSAGYRIETVHIRCVDEFCEIDAFSADDGFVYQYVPEHFPRIYLTNVLMEHLDRSALEKVPRFIDSLHISHSSVLKSISLPVALQCLTITSTSLRWIDIAPNSSLIQLNVLRCDLVKMPRTIRQARSLYLLEIRMCKLRQLDLASVCENARLFFLSLKGNQIRSIVNTSTRYCGAYESLNWLVLSENRLFVVNMELFPSFVKLQHLLFANNRIRLVAGRFVHKALRKLNMNSNKLTRLDLCGWYLPLLTQLTIERNSLELFPKCVSNISNLSMLSLTSNKLSYFTIESVAGLYNLVLLLLSHNQLTSVMMNTERFPANLKTIAIDNNNLTELDLRVIPVESLRIDATYNQILTFHVNGTSPNVAQLLMQHNPMDCSWKSPVQREQVQCKTVSNRTV